MTSFIIFVNAITDRVCSYIYKYLLYILVDAEDRFKFYFINGKLKNKENKYLLQSEKR